MAQPNQAGAITPAGVSTVASFPQEHLAVAQEAAAAVVHTPPPSSPAAPSVAKQEAEQKRNEAAGVATVAAAAPLANAPTITPTAATTPTSPNPAPLTATPPAASAQPSPVAVPAQSKVVAPLNVAYGKDLIAKIRAAFHSMYDDATKEKVNDLNNAIVDAEEMYASRLRYVVAFELDPPVQVPKILLDLEKDVQDLLLLKTKVDATKANWLKTPEPKVEKRSEIVKAYGVEFKTISDRVWDRYDNIRKLHQQENEIVVSTQHANLSSNYLKNVSHALHLEPENYQKYFEGPSESIWEQHFDLSRRIESANNDSIAHLRHIAGVIEDLGKAVTHLQGYPATHWWPGKIDGGEYAKSPFEHKSMQYNLSCTQINKSNKPV